MKVNNLWQRAEELADQEWEIEFETAEYSDGSSVIVAKNLDFPRLMAHGETQEEALNELREATQVRIHAMLKRGAEIPIPKKVKPYSPKAQVFYISQHHNLHIQESPHHRDNVVNVIDFLKALEVNYSSVATISSEVINTPNKIQFIVQPPRYRLSTIFDNDFHFSLPRV